MRKSLEEVVMRFLHMVAVIYHQHTHNNPEDSVQCTVMYCVVCNV